MISDALLFVLLCATEHDYSFHSRPAANLFVSLGYRVFWPALGTIVPGLLRLVVCDEAKTPIDKADIGALFLTTAVSAGRRLRSRIMNMERVAKCVMYDIVWHSD